MRASFGALQLALAFLLAVAAPHATASDDGAGVHWRGSWHPAAELPVTMSAPARAAVGAWAEWAAAERYRLDLDARGLVLLASPTGHDRHARWLELAEATARIFEELLPAPVRAPAEAARAPAPITGDPKPGGLPEDPEEGPAGAGLAGQAPSATTTAAAPARWGVAARELDTETVVLFILRDEAAQAALLQRIADGVEYLRSWAKEARAVAGFLLEAPLAGAYLLAAEGQEEWNPDNELVNRLTQLLVLRRFGQEPYWLVQGFAWYVEVRLCGAIYCFPHRSEFVWATEHTGWDQDLARRFEKQKGAVDVADFAGWKRGKYQEAPAKVSYGMLTFLAREHGRELPGFLEALRLHRDLHDRVPRAGGGWERNPAYQIPHADLARLLGESFGKDVLKEAADYFRAGLPVEGD